MEYYVNIKDNQSGGWYVGVCQTIEEWKNSALVWCDSDNNEELYEIIEKHELDEKLIDMISDIWSIEIVKLNKENYFDIVDSLDFEELKTLIYGIVYCENEKANKELYLRDNQ